MSQKISKQEEFLTSLHLLAQFSTRGARVFQKSTSISTMHFTLYKKCLTSVGHDEYQEKNTSWI